MNESALFRLLSLLSLVGTMAVSASCRYRARRGETIERSREGLIMMAGRILVAMPLFGGVLLHLAAPGGMTWATWDAPMWVRWGGAVMGLFAVPMAWWVFRSLGSNVSETVLTKERHTLVCHGPYRWVRHPLYLTGLLLFTGVAGMQASWFVLLFTGAAVVGLITVIIPREEAGLLDRFGDQYRDMMHTTGRLLPRLL